MILRRIKIISVFLIFCLGWSSTSVGQSDPKPTEEAYIRHMEVVWMTALANKDSVTLDACMAPVFELAKVGGDPTTNISRQQWISNALDMDWSKFAFREMQVKIDSNIATVNAVLSFKLKPYPFRLSSGVLDVWKKSNGKWKIEKRYLGADNLEHWLLILSGIGIGVAILLVWRWVKRSFAASRAHHHHQT